MAEQTTRTALTNLPAATLAKLARTMANGSEAARRVAAAAADIVASQSISERF
jgi:hypothetical protein